MDFQSYLELGRKARERGDHPAALERFQAAAAANPQNAWPQIEIAATLRSLGRTAEAEAAYHAVLAVHPDHPARSHALLGLGHCARARGDHAAALERFQAAAAANPRDPWPGIEAAAALRSLGRTAEAEAAYQSVLTAHPGNYHATLGLGLVARQQGDRAVAAAHFRAAAEARPDISAAWTELAAELRDAGEHDVAREVIGKPLARNPADLQALLGLGRIERSAGRRQDALAAFQRARELHPQNPYPLIEAAAELRALGQPEEARQLLLLARERDAANLQAMEQLGELARVARGYEEALDWFRQAIAIRPTSIWAYLGAARTLSDLGRRDEAAALIEEAERNGGRAPELDSLRVDLLRLAGDWLRALTLAREAAAAAPRHFGIWMQRFRMERLLSRPEEVEACLEAAPAVSVADRLRLDHFRGQAAEEQWRLDDAIGYYGQALDLRPEDTWALSDLIRARILALDLPAARTDLAKLTQLTASSAILQGRSQNMSQTHFGQILDEFELDRDALAELTALRGLPAEQRLDPLQATVRRFPDYTPAAMMLLIALRQSGRFTSCPDETARLDPAIPQRMVQFWDSPDLPPEVVALMQTWREAHPHYSFELFDDQKAQSFLQATCSAKVLQAYRRSRELAQKADIFRLAYLFARGGYYIDADDRCLAPIGTVVPQHASLALYQEDYGTLGNNFIGATPRHPVLGLALELAVSAINQGDNDILWFATGPGLLTRALARTLCCSGLNMATWLRTVSVLPRVDLHQAVAMHCQLAYKNTERHWSNTAFGPRRKLDASKNPSGRKSNPLNRM